MELPMTRPRGVNPASSTSRNSFTLRSEVKRRRPPEISVSFSRRRASSGNCCWGISVTVRPFSTLRQQSVERAPRLLRPLCLFGQRGYQFIDPLGHRHLFGRERDAPNPAGHRAANAVVVSGGGEHDTTAARGEIHL